MTSLNRHLREVAEKSYRCPHPNRERSSFATSLPIIAGREPTFAFKRTQKFRLGKRMASSRPNDTHFYDGRLGPIKATIEQDLIQASQKTFGEKLCLFQVLRSRLPKEAHRNFDVIVQDFIRTGRAPGPNYDPSNDLYADDLLYLCGKLALDLDWNAGIVELIASQLVEMSSGICAQGRTHRLLQILWALRGNPPQ